MRLTASFPMGGAGEEIVESCLKLLKGKKKKKKTQFCMQGKLSFTNGSKMKTF